MSIKGSKLFASAALLFTTTILSTGWLQAQSDSQPKPKPEDTEVWEPVPPVVTPGANNTAPPSDAIVLFDGKNVDEWVMNKDKSPAVWTVADGVVTVKKGPDSGSIETKRTFKDYQL